MLARQKCAPSMAELVEIEELRAAVEGLSREMGQLRSFVDRVIDQPVKSDQCVAAQDLKVLAQMHLRVMQSRGKFLPNSILRDPGWAMLLDLFVKSEAGQNVSVSSACLASGGPPTTALRWLTTLEREGLVEREQDRSDARRVFVRLTPMAYHGILRWLSGQGQLEQGVQR